MIFGFFIASTETDETGSMIGHDGYQNSVGGLPVLRVRDDKFNAHTVA